MLRVCQAPKGGRPRRREARRGARALSDGGVSRRPRRYAGGALKDAAGPMHPQFSAKIRYCGSRP